MTRYQIHIEIDFCDRFITPWQKIGRHLMLEKGEKGREGKEGKVA
jgi:hypothetical protein